MNYQAKFFANRSSKGLSDPKCPSCGGKEWHVEQPFEHEGRAERDGRKGSLVVLPIICRRCFAILNFSWRPIKNGE